MTEKKVVTKLINYDILNKLSTDFEKWFVTQTESSAEQAFWSQYSVQTDEPNLSVKEKITTTAITEGTWGFEHTKACFRDDIIPFVKSLKELFTSFDQCLIDEVTEVQNVFTQMELAVEQHCDEKSNVQIKMENVLQENDRLLTQALSVEIAKDTVILNLKEKLNSLNGDIKDRDEKQNVKESKTLNIELGHQEKVLVIAALKEQLDKPKGKAVSTKAISLNPIDPKLLKVDVTPVVQKLRKNRTAHIDYIRHTQGEADTLRKIVERINLASSASGSMSPDNTKNNRIRQTQKSAKKNKVKDYIRTVKSSLNKASVVHSKSTSSVLNFVSNVNSNLNCASSNGCLFFDNTDTCVNASKKSKSVKTPVIRKI
nr:hypothetical protein [Tanacetum cinerariifolium]